MDKKVYIKIAEMETLKVYLPDYSARFHVRGISRAIKRNHRTISLALKSLESKGVTKHETLGKNKQYFLNFHNFLTKEYIKNTEFYYSMLFIEKHFIIKKMLTEISTKMKGTPLLIFGSYAKGEETKESDIDMLILKDKDWKPLVNSIKEFSARHNMKIHIIEMTQQHFESGAKEKENLIMEIMNNHVILNNVELFVHMFWDYYAE